MFATACLYGSNVGTSLFIGELAAYIGLYIFIISFLLLVFCLKHLILQFVTIIILTKPALQIKLFRLTQHPLDPKITMSMDTIIYFLSLFLSPRFSLLSSLMFRRCPLGCLLIVCHLHAQIFKYKLVIQIFTVMSTCGRRLLVNILQQPTGVLFHGARSSMAIVHSLRTSIPFCFWFLNSYPFYSLNF